MTTYPYPYKFHSVLGGNHEFSWCTSNVPQMLLAYLGIVTEQAPRGLFLKACLVEGRSPRALIHIHTNFTQ